MSGKISVENACQAQCLITVQERIKKVKCALSNQRAAQLWLVYMEMVAVLRKFIKAERLGDWTAHLQALNEMLPYFGSIGTQFVQKISKAVPSENV